MDPMRPLSLAAAPRWTSSRSRRHNAARSRHHLALRQSAGAADRWLTGRTAIRSTFSVTCGLQPTDPTNWIVDDCRRDETSCSPPFHMPRLLPIAFRNPEAESREFPVERIVALKNQMEGGESGGLNLTEHCRLADYRLQITDSDWEIFQSGNLPTANLPMLYLPQ
jgi:hypothetical protein